MKLTVEERDQWACLLADWSASYDFTISDDETDAQPFQAVPHANREFLLKAASPRLLRAKVAEDHARRATAPVQEA